MVTRLHRAVIAAVFMLAITLQAVPAMALLVRPILINMTTTGSASSAMIEVVNDRNRPMVIEVKVNRLDIPERGRPVVTPNDGADFLIFPQIASVAPGQRQVFRVRWVGEPRLAQSQLYMFSTSELPITERPDQTNVQVLYAIQSVVTVSSPDAAPQVAIAEVQRATLEGQSGLEVTFVNSGPRHGFVTDHPMELAVEGGWTRTLSPSELNAALGFGVLPANSRRVMFLPVSELPATGAVRASIVTRDN